MVDKGHTRIGTEVVSRRGHYDVLESLCLRSEIRPFFKSRDAELVTEEVAVVAQCRALDSDSPDVTDLEHQILPLRREVSDSESSSENDLDSQIDDLECMYTCGDAAQLERMMQTFDRQYRRRNLDSSGNLQIPSGGIALQRQRRRAPRQVCSRLQHGQSVQKSCASSLRQLLRSGRAEDGQIQALLRRRDMMKHGWTGVIDAAKTHLAQAPRQHLTVKQDGLFDGGHKANFERGYGVSGQGKRHQNAAVHRQPRQGQGRLAKWSSGPVTATPS